MRLYRMVASLIVLIVVLASAPSIADVRLYNGIPAPTPVLADALQSAGASIVGRVIDVDGGLPIPNAFLELTCTTETSQQTRTAKDGSFSFNGVQPGTCTILVSAHGYQDVSSASIQVAVGNLHIDLNVAMIRVGGAGAARTIGRVVVSSSSALQTSATINAHVDPTTVQSQGYARSGDLLISVPGVNTFTGSSIGDDLAVSIRGYDSTETATLLDGHPIGPIGAFGNGYDYQVSPFFGLRNVQTVFGSGATGIWGANTIAGTVNFETINPTVQPQAIIEQGVGGYGKALSGIAATGSASKFGYAFASAVQGTYGYFYPQLIPQTGLLGTDLTAANIAANTYTVSMNYLQRNTFGKLTYAFSPRTNLTVGVYTATSWDDKSGNGDNDNLSYQENLYNTETGLISSGGTSSVCLSNCGAPNEVDGTCSNYTQAVLADTSSGFQCMNPQQYAKATSGPSGGGQGPWQAIRNQDYHARLTQDVGKGQVNVDTYLDWYALDYNRSVANNSYHSDFYRTTGILVDDEYTFALNNLAFGYYYQAQEHTGDTAPYFPPFGAPPVYIQVDNQEFYLNQASYFVRDEWTPNQKFSIFANLWLQSSPTTKTTSFNPRLSFIYRPTGADVLRLSAGHSNSNPDPALLYAVPSFNTTPGNINPNCGAGGTSIGSVSNPSLAPETANDTELAYGHRFNQQTTLQLNFYNSNELDALFSGNLPLSALGTTNVPAGLINEYLARIAAFCKNTPTTADLTVSTTYNAAQARYRGMELAGTFPVGPVTGDFAYDVQSAAYNGVPDSILMSNPTIINGSQILGRPLHKINLGFDYAHKGFDATIDGTYIGYPNNYNRQPFSYANATLSQRYDHWVFVLGVNNLFNSAANNYGYFGLGLYQPENQFGTDQNAFQQSSEQFGLPYTNTFFTITYRT